MEAERVTVAFVQCGGRKIGRLCCFRFRRPDGIEKLLLCTDEAEAARYSHQHHHLRLLQQTDALVR